MLMLFLSVECVSEKPDELRLFCCTGGHLMEIKTPRPFYGSRASTAGSYLGSLTRVRIELRLSSR
jgi:hypothetical protein